MRDKDATDSLLRSYLPEFRKLTNPDTLMPSPSSPTASKLALRDAIAAVQAGIKKREQKP